MPGDGVDVQLRAPDVDLALLVLLLELSLLPGDLVCKGFIPGASNRELGGPETEEIKTLLAKPITFK